MQRLNELYAANGQVGFRMFERVDGKVTLSAAIKKMTQA
jgi:HK97 family phage major capsid protein